MGKHWAVETESSQLGLADTGFVRGDRPEDPQTAEAAEAHWREVRKLYFIPVLNVRRTTDEEDERLQQGLDEEAREKAEQECALAEIRRANATKKKAMKGKTSTPARLDFLVRYRRSKVGAWKTWMTVQDVSPLGAAQSCRIAFPDGTLLVAVLAADTATEAAFKELPKEYRFEEKRG